jgi:hypothetical protein
VRDISFAVSLRISRSSSSLLIGYTLSSVVP